MAETKSTPSSVLATAVKSRKSPSSSSSSSLLPRQATARVTTISDDSDCAESSHSKPVHARASSKNLTHDNQARDQLQVFDVQDDDDDNDDDVVILDEQKNLPVQIVSTFKHAEPRAISHVKDIKHSKSASKGKKVAQKRKVSKADEVHEAVDDLVQDSAAVQPLQYHPPRPNQNANSPLILGEAGSSECKKRRVIPMSMQCDMVPPKLSNKSFSSNQKRLPAPAPIVLHSPAYKTPQDS